MINEGCDRIDRYRTIPFTYGNIVIIVYTNESAAVRLRKRKQSVEPRG